VPKVGQTGKTDLVRLWDGSDINNIDSKRHGQVSITTPHDAVHDGIMFEISHVFDDVDAGGGTADILIVNGSSRELHITFHIVSGAEAYVYLYENPTITAAGTAIPIHDMNRTTSNSPASTTAYQGPTVGAVGTNLSQSLIEGGSAGRAIGGQVRWGTEWIFKKNEEYLVRIVNSTQSTQNISIQVEFYEV